MPELGPVTERLKALRNRAGLTVDAMAQELGLPKSTYAAYEDPKKRKGPLFPVPLVERFAEVLVPRGAPRELVMGLGGLTASGEIKIEPDDLADQLDAVLLPEIEVGYSMGAGADIADFPVVQMVPFSRSWLGSITHSAASELFVARGDGDSMMPTLLDGDIVIIDRGQKTLRQQDRIWTVSYAGFGMIKRLRALPDGSLQINSDNASVSPIIATDEEAFIIGRVVAIIRRI